MGVQFYFWRSQFTTSFNLCKSALKTRGKNDEGIQFSWLEKLEKFIERMVWLSSFQKIEKNQPQSRLGLRLL